MSRPSVSCDGGVSLVVLRVRCLSFFWRRDVGHDEALHELDPAFRKVTLQNERLRSLVRDLQFHKEPVGGCMIRSETYMAALTAQCSASVYGYYETNPYWRGRHVVFM